MTRFSDDWRLLPERIALHEPTATAVIADVHLGYSAARQRQGDAIPCRSVLEEMRPLLDAAQRYDIRALVVAGDLFEAGYDAELCSRFLEVLDRMRIRFLGLAPGNHDRGIDQAATPFAVFAAGFELADWRIVHGDQATEGERVVAGHWHPAARWKGRKAPCFLARGTRLILPAFSLDAAGVDAAKDRRWDGWRRYLIRNERVTLLK